MIDRKQLLTALAQCATVTPKTTPKELLKCIRLTASGGTITLVAHDSEIGLSVSLPCDSTEDIDIVVDPVRLTGVIKDAKADDVKLSMDSLNLLIQCDGKAKLGTTAAIEFPPTVSDRGDLLWTVDGEMLANALRKVSAAADPAPSGGRTAMAGVLFDNGPTLVATDSKVLIAATLGGVEHAKIEDRFFTCLTVKACKAIASIAAGEVSILRDENRVIARGDGWSLSAPLIQGRFPNWEKVLDPGRKFPNVLPVITDDLGLMLKRAAIFNDVESVGLEVTLSADAISVDNRKNGGEFASSIPASYTGEPMTLNVDPNLIGKAFDAAGDTAEMRLVDDSSMIYIEAGSVRAAVMPLEKR